MKRPAFQAYPSDWRKDIELQSCSIGARGLWWELMCLMHESDPYGHLTLNGKPMPDPVAAGLVRVPLALFRKLLAELEAAGVPSRTPDGALYSRRMVRDETLRNVRAAGGINGAEHGIKGKEAGIKGGRPRKSTADKKPPLKPPLLGNGKPPPSSSSSPSGLPEDLRSSSSGGDAPDTDQRTTPRDERKAANLREFKAQAASLLDFLNETAGRKYPPTDSNIGIVVARLREGFTAQQIRQVIANRVRKWKGDPEMNEYLRPETLFGPRKFSGYVGQIVDDPADEADAGEHQAEGATP